jgi:anti-sigma-K factor RskA
VTPRKPDESSLSGAYSLHALNDDEAKSFEAHLADSEETRNEVTELSDTAVLLGLAVDPETPPPSLKASIMAQLATTPQLDREPAAEASPDAPFSTPAQAKARARWFARPLNAVVGVSAAIALIVGGGVAVNAISTSVSQQAAADHLAAIYSATDSQLKRAPIDGGGRATLVWAESLGSSALMVEGMDPPPADKVYELWYIDADGARPAGTFTVGPEGSTWRLLEGTMAAGDTVGVTVEPPGGSSIPSTDPIVLVASA